MDNELSRKIDAFIEENRDRILWDMTRLVGVPSVQGEPEEEAPFGPGPRKALDMALTIARELGLEAVDCEHHIGYAEVSGEREEYLATICHVDVVPVGEGWESDPYVLRERDGYLIGRGIMDDKGPAVISLYALKFLKEQGIRLRYPVRALLGANEETGMKDVDYYNEHFPAPLFCFSPDADFPLINGEKGGAGGYIVSLCDCTKIIDIKGGDAHNAVPSKATARILTHKILEPTDRVEVEQESREVWKLTAHGVGGHAAHPEGTVSAIGVLEDYILDNELASPEEAEYLRFAVKIPHAPDGSLVGVAADDGLFDPLTIISGTIEIADGRIRQSFDSRFPTNTSVEKIKAQLIEAAGTAAHIEDVHGRTPFYKDPHSRELKACIAAYREVTGDHTAEPFTIGGGTYARHFPNAVGFGPEHPERKQPEFVGPIHGANEGACFADLLEALKIYIVALLNLEEIDF